MNLLKYLDVLIGLAVVMILLSPAVTGITQLVLGFCRLRPTALKAGIRDLILQLASTPLSEFASVEFDSDADTEITVGGLPKQKIKAHEPLTVPSPASTKDNTFEFTTEPPTPVRVRFVARPTLTIAHWTPAAVDLQGDGHWSIALGPERVAAFSSDDAKKVADSILLHPMIATPRARFAQWLKLKAYVEGTVVEREELIRILLEFAAKEGAGNGFDDTLRQTLRMVLARNGIADPAQTLANIRLRAQELEHDDPAVAAHVRQTQAIIDRAKGDFVGKINNWFDQVMLRVTNRYTFWARVITVFSALIVAVALQFDSVDLIKRLSADDALRASLLTEAQTYQAQLDKLPTAEKGATVDQQLTADAAKAQLDEVQRNLATLRGGQLAILPERLPWQWRAQTRLTLSEAPPPYPNEFELVLGTGRYTIRPRWAELNPAPDRPAAAPLEVLQRAIEESRAPVDIALQKSADSELVMDGGGFEAISITAAGGQDPNGVSVLLHQEDDLLRATIRASDLDTAPAVEPVKWEFAIDDGKPLPVSLEKGKDRLEQLEGAVRAGIRTRLFRCPPDEPAKEPAAQRVKQDNDAPPAPCRDTLTLVTSKPENNWLFLRTVAGDPASDLLRGRVERVARRARIRRLAVITYAKANNPDAIRINGNSLCEGPSCADPDLRAVQTKLERSGVRATVRSLDQLVLTSRSGGDIELRYRVGHPETNVLHRNIEWVKPDYLELLSVRMFSPGIILTWILLSLGAPFWYEMLKDTLRLRPALAQREEAQRRERQDDTTKPQGTPPSATPPPAAPPPAK